MQMILAIALGGAVGAVARHVLAHRIALWLGHGFPFGIMIVNILGSFLMGVLVTLLATRLQLAEEMRAFLAVGVLGGFTTFSTFSLETAMLIERNQMLEVALYVGGSVILSVVGLFAGMWLARVAL